MTVRIIGDIVPVLKDPSFHVDDDSIRFLPQQKILKSEPGDWWGHNDVLEHDTNLLRVNSSRNNKKHGPVVGYEPDVANDETTKIYIHISRNFISSFTGKLREYFLPWRWKTAFLDKRDDHSPCRILYRSCKGVTTLLDTLSGKSLEEIRQLTELWLKNHYYNILGKEFIRVSTSSPIKTITITAPLGKAFGVQTLKTAEKLCHVFRKQGLFSSLKYWFLQHSSNSWKEVTLIQTLFSEKVLIHKNDEASLSKVGLLRARPEIISASKTAPKPL